MGKKLYVGNLSYGIDSSALEQLFAQFGTVSSAQVISDRETGRSKGFGFVEMSSDDEATKAIAEMNGKQHDGRAPRNRATGIARRRIVRRQIVRQCRLRPRTAIDAAPLSGHARSAYPEGRRAIFGTP